MLRLRLGIFSQDNLEFSKAQAKTEEGEEGQTEPEEVDGARIITKDPGNAAQVILVCSFHGNDTWYGY